MSASQPPRRSRCGCCSCCLAALLLLAAALAAGGYFAWRNARRVVAKAHTALIDSARARFDAYERAGKAPAAQRPLFDALRARTLDPQSNLTAALVANAALTECFADGAVNPAEQARLESTRDFLAAVPAPTLRQALEYIWRESQRTPPAP